MTELPPSAPTGDAEPADRTAAGAEPFATRARRRTHRREVHGVGAAAEPARKRNEARARDGFDWRSPAMQQVERLLGKVAPTDSIVLITGEGGTGKGLLARSLHQQSRRAARPFVPVNCGAIPASRLETEFFGQDSGTPAGAERARKGLFAQADGGTLFLEEISELPPDLQLKLLHVLEARELRPVDSEATRTIDVRVVAASNHDLQQLVATGAFRQDLYFRISGFHVAVPPLRERREDIPVLIRHLLGHGGERFGVAGALSVDARAEEILVAHDWPGNVRELENVLQRAAILCDGGHITAADLPPQLASAAGEASGTFAQPVHGALREQVRHFEQRAILRAIEAWGGEHRAAARRIGIGLSSLYRKLEEPAPPPSLAIR
jgi:two-component system, NtrC family, response regulator AtoC